MCREGVPVGDMGLAAWLQLRSREEGMAHPLASLQESIYGGCRVYIMHDECLSLNLVQPGRHLISSAQLGCCGPILGSIPPGTILSLSLSVAASVTHPPPTQPQPGARSRPVCARTQIKPRQTHVSYG